MYPFTSWQYLGSVHNGKPSTILRFKWPQDMVDKNITAQLGITIVNLDNITYLEMNKMEEKRNILTSEGDTTLNKVGLFIVIIFI
jgi:hypothetical protein